MLFSVISFKSLILTTVKFSSHPKAKNMKSILIILLKGIGILFGILLIGFAILYYKSVNYNTYSLKVERSNFPEVQTTEDIAKLAGDLVAQMTLKEKIDQLYGEKKLKVLPKLAFNFLVKKRFPHVYGGRNDRLNIPPWVLSDGPRGARVMHKEVNGVTTFPVAMSRGASWDIDLERRIHEAIAIEMRANETNYAATPCLNLLRHPGWGRAQETYGEDSWLLGEFGVVAVQALESHNVMACPKHFALNSIDNSRYVVDVQVDDRTLREVYLPHFKKTIQEGKPASLMSAYNSVRGNFCGSNKELITDILRDEWGFEGFVSTDWFMGLYDGVAGVQAGLDVEMPWQSAYSYDALKKGIEEGIITEADIDNLVSRTLKTRLKYAFAEDAMNYSFDLIAQSSHIELAREAAEKGMVLLKNENVLPFKNSANKKVAVIGRLADMPNTGDQGSSNSTTTYVVTPYQGLKKYHEAFGNEVILNDGSDIESAKNLVAESDEVIIVVGYTHEDEGEYIITSRDEMVKSAKAHKLVGVKGSGGDRENLNLLPQDVDLILALAGINENLVVNYVGGSAIDMTVWEEKVPAILFSWYSGMEGGNALANILYGEANPGGKLPFTIAKDTKDYPFFNPYTDTITYGYYHGYTLFDKKNLEVAYPFGFGLSYTTYAYGNMQILSPEVNKEGKISVSVDVTNTGSMEGEEIIQLYIGFKNSAVDRPVKLLRDFQKVALAPNETKTVALEVDSKDLAWYNPETHLWEIESMEYEVYIGSSSAKKDLLSETFIIN
jgi:beta-glucosidase